MERRGVVGRERHALGRVESEGLAVEGDRDLRRLRAEHALPGQVRGDGAALRVALEHHLHFGRRPREIHPLARHADLAALVVERPGHELVRRELRSEVDAERPGCLREVADILPVELEDHGSHGRAHDDRDRPGADDEAEEEGCEGDHEGVRAPSRGRGQLAATRRGDAFFRTGTFAFFECIVVFAIQDAKPSEASSTRYARISGSS